MYEDYVDFGFRMRVHLGDFEAFDVVEIDGGALCFHVIVSLAGPAQYSVPIRFACTYHACALFSLFCLPYTLHQTRTGPRLGLFIYGCSFALTICHGLRIHGNQARCPLSSEEEHENVCLRDLTCGEHSFRCAPLWHAENS